jgi:hypothetical protein
MNMQLQLLVGVIEYSDLELTCDIYQTEWSHDLKS